MVVGPSSVSWLSSLECEKFDIYGLGNNGEGEKGGGKEAEIVRTASALFFFFCANVLACRDFCSLARGGRGGRGEMGSDTRASVSHI